MSARRPNVVHLSEVPEQSRTFGQGWGAHFKPLTPVMGDGHLRVNWMRVPPGRTAVPFHGHRLEDEVFFVLSGSGVLRYGDDLVDVAEGDCIACPRGSGEAHQLLNTGEQDLVYLAMGPREPEEVCFYPDSGKVMVRGLGRVGSLEDAAYMDGEGEVPRIVELVAGRARP